MELYYLHNNYDGGNVISMLPLNINIANEMESSKLGDDGFDEHDIFSPAPFEEKICFDDNMLPKYDDYHDDNDCFTLTISNEKDYAYVESKSTFLHVDRGNNALCDTYIVEFIHDPTENYYEKGTYAYRYFNNIKFPLFMLKVLKLHLFCLPMLIALCFNELFY